MDRYIEKGGKRLRLGYTTGSCAAAAAKAAAWMLLSGECMESVSLQTPGGIRLDLRIRDITREDTCVSCAAEKDSGDDPDVTSGTLIFAAVSRTASSGISIDGGKGIGRVTKPGLDQPVGAAAINSVPRRMIRENVEEVCRRMGYAGGLSVLISAPDGERLAEKTFNPRLGIVGGISILGTTGIVEPMSDQALTDTIRAELGQRRAIGEEYVLLTPGNYGSAFIREHLGLSSETAVMTSNFIGDGLDACRELCFRGVLLVGHIGKLVKLAGGMFNTHSRYGDCRMDILTAAAASCGLSMAGAEEMAACATCDDALRILREESVCEETLHRLIRRISGQLQMRTGKDVETGVILFSSRYGLLEKTENAEKLLQCIREG